jgi:hypothetical protein
LTAMDATINLFTRERLLLLYTKAPQALWRHDVDVSLDAAARMARFAQLAGVKTTFCVMARGEFYNPFYGAGERALTEIVDAGQRICMHVDYRGDGDPRVAVERDWALWTLAYPGLIDDSFLAFHMPPLNVIWKDFEGFDHAHSSQWEGCYVSDSRREWSIEKEARVVNGMQIALHPEYWFGG